MLAPALVIAQDEQADASAQPVAAEPSAAAEPPAAAEPAPAAEAPAAEPQPATEAPAEPPKAEPEPQAAPAQEPAPEPTAQEQKADKEQKPDKAPDQAPAADPKAEQAPVESAPEAAPAEPERTLVIDSQPEELDLVVGDTAKLSAWLCPPGDMPFGPDEKPATADGCSPAIDVRWSVKDEGVASFEAPDANHVRLAAVAVIAATKVVATLDEQTAKAELTISAAPSPAANDAVTRSEHSDRGASADDVLEPDGRRTDDMDVDGATTGRGLVEATPHEAPGG